MPVTLTLNERNPQDQALIQRLRSHQSNQHQRILNPFPFSLLEQMLRLCLDGLEAVVRLLVTAVEHAIKRRNGVRSR